jgi:hypothetical protein
VSFSVLLVCVYVYCTTATGWLPNCSSIYNFFNRINQPDADGDSSAVGRGWAGRPEALLSPSSDGKPEAATAVVVAPDDGHENARNMLSCT